MNSLDLHTIQAIVKKRNPNANKSHHGHALLVAGSKAKMGAAIIAAKACLRSGAGLVTLNISRKERQAVFAAIPEAMIAFREEDHSLEKHTAFGIGPGLGTDKSAERKVASLLENIKLPIVLDADALTVLANNPKLFTKIPPNSIVTPHEKEFDRMFGQHANNPDRRQTAIQKATEFQLVIVLKSSQTFITNGSQNFLNTTGNAGLAKGGSGDALTGMITAFTAQGYEPLQAACLGVFLHGLAADITLETQSEESMLISDVIENIGKAFRKIEIKDEGLSKKG
ncbi:NAD(P)H-hydrate dehydratase [Flavobacterium sedimenticola]|uniref:ADP-dependent (S)-NAD(P)H-hydrate dehydratase n=1 Tax=Flavobacterium sedimenticola TaxID=3043286 RepID=A0ABT6XM97_9FLAO|nr:NAD(P)H-hydrate dehydratase [Flavobacterium sedimenticola]MDI9256095.1 NAD(P)H-hydrate dehydratase [Flavobacterium sedimenticola]